MRLSRVLVALVVVGVCVPMATAATLQMTVAARWAGPEGIVPVTEKTVLDPDYNPYLLYDVAVKVSADDNMGLGGVVFQTYCQAMADQGLYMWTYYDAEGGYGNMGAYPGLRTILDPAYPSPQPSTGTPDYAGGWGFDNQGLPTGGVATAPGKVLDAGNAAPLIWGGDNSILGGLQSFTLLGVGHHDDSLTWPGADDGLGRNIGRPEDPTFAGTALGRTVQGPTEESVPPGVEYKEEVYGLVPQDLANGVVPGFGEWVMFRTWINMTEMDDDVLYTVDIVPTDGNWLMFPADFTGDSVGSTYYDELQGGFRAPFTGGDMTGDSFSFYIPEPATVGLLLVGGLALVRRRR